MLEKLALLSSLAAVTLVSFACDSAGAAGATSQPAQTRTEALGDRLDESQFDLIAGGVLEGPAITVADILADPESYLDKTSLRIEGEITRVCQNRGCWFDVGNAEQSIHVTFAAGCSEYMPLDSAGRTVRVEGKLQGKPSEAQREHIAEDMAKAETPTPAPELVLSFVATGAAIAK